MWGPDTVIFEGMFIINSCPLLQHKSFLDYACFFVKRRIYPYVCKTSVKEIHVIFDYFERQGISPKQLGRFRRDEISSADCISDEVVSNLENSSELLSDWKSFLAERQSKRSLVNYLSDTFLAIVPKIFREGQSFTTAGGFDGHRTDKAYICTKFDTCENHSLKFDQEESDSRVRFHAF